MWSVNWVIGGAWDLVLQPFRLGHPLWPLGLFAILTGIAMLIVFRYISDQRGIKRAQDRIKAHLVEL